MSTWTDVGARLQAAEQQQPVPRCLYAPTLPPQHPLTVCVDPDRATLHATDDNGPVHLVPTDDPTAAMTALRGLGAHSRDEQYRTLVVPDPATLTTLTRLAHAHAATSRTARRRAPRPGPATPPAPAILAPADDAAAVVLWWQQRAQHPGTHAVLVLTRALPERWALGVDPQLDRDISTWLAWLDIDDTGPHGTLQAARRLAAGAALPGLSEHATSDEYSWQARQRRLDAGDGYDRPDGRDETVLGLASRSHAAELYTSQRLDDPAVRVAAVHQGTVVPGTVIDQPTPTSLVMVTDHLINRLRTGTDVAAWTGEPADHPERTMAGTVSDATIGPTGRLLLTITGLSSRTKISAGSRLTLRPAPANAHQQRRARQNLRTRLRRPDNWLARNRTVQPQRRHVPLDVVIASATDD